MWEVGARWAKLRGGGYGDYGIERIRHIAHAAADKKLRSVRRELEEIGDGETFYEILGLGMNKIARVLSEGMDATKVVPMARKIDRDTQEIVEMGPYIDHPTRVESAMNAARLRGEIRRPPSGDAEKEPDVRPVSFVFNILGPTQVVTSG